MIPRKLLQHAFVILTLFLSLTISSSFADESARTGTFKGLNKHDTSGSVTLVQTPDGPVIEFGDDFSFDGAPDPKVALGKDGEYDPATLIRLLDANSGAQSYAVPDSIDVSEYNEIHIWCEKYSVGLGVASLK